MTNEQQETLIAGLLDVDTLMNESGGVFGLHMNGDPSPWEELRSGGRFEEWLVAFDKAMNVIAKNGDQADDQSGLVG